MTLRTHFHQSLVRALVLPAAVLVTATLFAQAPSPQEKIAAFKESMAKNQAALRQYTWTETTDISLKGSDKKHEQKQCQYGADGKVQKTPIGGGEEKESSGGGGGRRRGDTVKKVVVKNKIDDIKEYMAKVTDLIQDYAPPNPQKIQAAQAAGTVKVEPGTKLVITNYLKAGDSLAVGFDSASQRLTSYNVLSYVEKPKEDDVTLTVTYARLPDGTSYPQQTVLEVKAKEIVVKMVNAGYKKSGS
jgi:hypothetical protein